MMQPNGRNPSPLALNRSQRRTALAKLGLQDGWLLLSVSEMFELKKSMDGATAENERLNKQTARLVARSLVNAAVADKALRSARTLLEALAHNSNEPTTRIDALNELANIDEALSILPTPETEEKKPEDPEAKP